MDSIWLKIAVAVVLIIGIFVAVTALLDKADDKLNEPTRTVYDQDREDRQAIMAEPKKEDFEKPQPEAKEKPAEPVKQPEVIEQPIEQVKPKEPLILYFTELDQVEQVDAERQLQAVVAGIGVGRKPMLGYKMAVDSGFRIINKYKGSIYDYKVRKAFKIIPERYWRQYKITDETVDLEYFKKQRPNTVAHEIKEEY